MSVISADDYQSIAISYANARAKELTKKDDFYDAVDVIVKLNEIQPEVDLLIPFYDAYNFVNTDTQNTVDYDEAVRSINKHVITQGGYADIDAYLEEAGLLVPTEWADLCASVGYNISEDNVDDFNNSSSSSSST